MHYIRRSSMQHHYLTYAGTYMANLLFPNLYQNQHEYDFDSDDDDDGTGGRNYIGTKFALTIIAGCYIYYSYVRQHARVE